MKLDCGRHPRIDEMARITVKQVQAMAARYGCEFYRSRGKDYFYFRPCAGVNFYDEGVYTPVLGDNLQNWEEELRAKFTEAGLNPDDYRDKGATNGG